MIQVLMPFVFSTALLGSGAFAATSGAGSCGQAEVTGTAWQVLVRLDLQPAFADTGSGAQGAAPAAPRSSTSEVETYIRFHYEAAAGDARPRLMPWPELRSLAP